MLLSVPVGGKTMMLPPPELPPWWKFDLFDNTRVLLSTATERIGWSSSIKETIDEELRMRRANDNPQPRFESISQRLEAKQRRCMESIEGIEQELELGRNPRRKALAIARNAKLQQRQVKAFTTSVIYDVRKLQNAIDNQSISAQQNHRPVNISVNDGSDRTREELHSHSNIELDHFTDPFRERQIQSEVQGSRTASSSSWMDRIHVQAVSDS
ncbi:hypothetical protein BDZ94DRAFT_1261306 [Collybia nuda]|uniref:Uncharacterized protein n=1 Tax=Collybia nuda TaxID=64659 RepID=A0A9P6CJ25_9AGAR|nr:hypothetical protein BDZ94DRAFT_1261306 [Collybia nuda]